jgi:hypothetical protein
MKPGSTENIARDQEFSAETEMEQLRVLLLPWCEPVSGLSRSGSGTLRLRCVFLTIHFGPASRKCRECSLESEPGPGVCAVPRGTLPAKGR